MKQNKEYAIGPLSFVRFNDYVQGHQLQSLFVIFDFPWRKHGGLPGIEIRWRPNFAVKLLWR